jgi:hypothetical protein
MGVRTTSFLQALLNAACPGLGEMVWDDERWREDCQHGGQRVVRDQRSEIADCGWNRLSFNNFINFRRHGRHEASAG